MKQKTSKLDLLICDIYDYNMTRPLYHILLELDNQIIETDDYFSWSDERKNDLNEFIGRCFKPILKQGQRHKQHLMAGLWNIIKECEYNEEYEQAEILRRALMNLENGYWK